MNTKIIILGFLALTATVIVFSSLHQTTSEPFDKQTTATQFSFFKNEFAKTYSSLSEMDYRMQVFASNSAIINQHNSNLKSTYKLGINQFSDITFEEFSAKYLRNDPEDNYQMGPELNSELYYGNSDGQEVDWVKAGIVGKVKNQASCGSCWAFSAVSVVEEAYALFKKVPIPNLSEQELVDCSTSYGNEGCGGGFSFQGLDYIREKGINNGKDYPYKAVDLKCKSKLSGKGWAKIEKWTVLLGGPGNLADGLRQQPTTASFHVQSDFMQYKSGVYNPTTCIGNRNHAVNAVGFKLDASVPYFIVRNSWGSTWGEEGLFKIAAKSGNGTCWFNGEGRSTFPTLAQ